MPDPSAPIAARALLNWYADMDVDDVVGPDPRNWFETPAPDETRMTVQNQKSAAQARSIAAPGPTAMPADEAVAAANEAARRALSFDDLAAAVAAFDGCPLKAGARNTVFADGAPHGDLLVIGEAPGRDEDRIGKPFVGRAGHLLDKMLAAIGRSREADTLISNVIYWRPPGNRTPTQLEIAICKPFVERLIDLVNPKAVLLVGGAPTSALLGLTGIMRARGVWREIKTASGRHYPALPTFHPAFLLRQPAQKRLAWSDLVALETKLRDG